MTRPLTSRPPTVIAVFAVVLTLFLTNPCSAQDVELEARYERLEWRQRFRYVYRGEERECNVGRFRWAVSEGVFSTGGLDREFSGFCAEVMVPMVSGRWYRFRLEPAAGGGLWGGAGEERLWEWRWVRVRELYGRYYGSLRGPEEVGAFQVALWELLSEGEGDGVGGVRLDLFRGDFQAAYGADQAPGYVLLAQRYLSGLTGDGGEFERSGALAGRELVLLRGVLGEGGEVGQSQLALREVSGGVTGDGFGGVGGVQGVGGGAGLGGGFSGVGGLGGATGGGTGGGAGGFFNGGGSGSGIGGDSGGNGNGAGNGGGSGVGGGGGGGGGGSGGGGSGGGGGGGIPVPGPSGIILGIAALGALAGRKLLLNFKARS